MAYEISWEQRCVRRRFYGPVTGSDILASLREICGDSRFDDLRGGISDYCDATSLQVSEQDAAMITALQIGAGCSNPYFRLALVVTDPRVAGELRRAVALFRPGPQVEFHGSVESARRWLKGAAPLGSGIA